MIGFKKKLKLYIFLSYIIPIFSNIISVFFSRLISKYIYSKEFYNAFEKIITDTPTNSISNFAPFNFATLCIIIYLIPIYIYLFKEDFKLVNKIKIKILNGPLIISFIGILSWLLGGFLFNFIPVFYGFEFHFNNFFSSLIATSIFGATTFVFSYYSLELCTRIFIIPYIFQSDILSETKGVLNISVRNKLFI